MTRRPLVFGAIVLAAVAAVGIGVVIRHDRSTPGPCSSIPIAASPADSSAPMTSDKVLLFESSVGPMSGSSVPFVNLVIDVDGMAVAPTHVAPYGTPDEPAYRRAQLGADTVAAIRACLTSRDFQSLSPTNPAVGFTNANDRFCAVADAPSYLIAAGPASGTTKAIGADALPFLPDDCADRTNRTLYDLSRGLADLASAIGTNGSPSDTQPTGLAPPTTR